MGPLGGHREVVEPLHERVRLGVGALAHFILGSVPRSVEALRVARAAYALASCGCSAKSPFISQVVQSFLVAVQRDDGGWADVEETVWCLGCLAVCGRTPETVRGEEWLGSVRLTCGAWGRSARDMPRVPITGLVSAVVPTVVRGEGLNWLSAQWESDLAGAAPLTYKGAFFLLSQAHALAPQADRLVHRTIDYLCSEQEEDGGFGPWKGHPMGSDPWSTGVVLWGLSRFAGRVLPKVFDTAAEWLAREQLPDGHWRYHYLDDGTSMALIGASSILPLLHH